VGALLPLPPPPPPPLSRTGRSLGRALLPLVDCELDETEAGTGGGRRNTADDAAEATEAEEEYSEAMKELARKEDSDPTDSGTLSAPEYEAWEPTV
jgi:hypothetical protein